MKKSLLLMFALLILGGANVYAGKTYWNPEGWVASWDNETNTMSWNGSDYFKVMRTHLPASELSVDTKIHVTVSNIIGENDYIQLKIVSTGKPELMINLVEGENVIVFEDYSNNINWEAVTEITLWGTGGQNGSAVITDFYMYKPTTLTFNNSGVATIGATEIVAYDGLSITSDGVVTTDGTDNGYLEVTFADPVDLSDLSYLAVSQSGDGNIIYWTNLIKSDGTKVHNNGDWYSSKFGISFNAEQAARATDVKKIRMQAGTIAKNDGESDEDYATRVAGLSLTITGFTITATSMSLTDAHDVAIASLPHYSVAANGTASLTSAIATSYGSDVEVPLGDGSSLMNEYIDIADYDELRVYTENNARIFFINETIKEGTNDKDGGTQYLQGDGTIFSHNTTEGYYYVSVSDIKAIYGGQAKVIGLKGASWGAKLTVSKIQVIKENPTYDYILSGHYSSAYDLSALTSSTTATLVDATGLKGNNVTLTSANPNCIFKANAGVLANANNVMVGTTIANLEITDGHPFAVPTGATATAATYSRTMANQFGTICLPYPVASTATVKYYTIASLSGDELTLHAEENLAAGTPAIVEKVSGDAITVTGSGALAVAGEPTEDLALIGTYTAKTILASAYAPKNIYAISNNQFVQATTDITLPAFRAYFVSTPASASLRLGFEEEGATAIEALSGEGDVVVEGIYSLDGAQIPSLQQGVNIVKFTNGEVKKVIVK